MLTKSLFEMTLALAVVIAIIFAIAYIFRRVNQQYFMGNNLLKAISSVAIGQRERIVVFQAGEKQFLLGVTTSSITLLHEFSEPLIIEAPLSTISFKEQLAKIVKKGAKE